MNSPPQRDAETRPRDHSQISQQFKGVRRRNWGKWVSEVRIPNSRERIWLGSYDTPEQAARAYDAAVYCLRGEKANFNFPDSPPEIPCASSMSREEIKAVATRFALEWPPSTLAASASASASESDTRQISTEAEELALLESSFAGSANNFYSISDIFPP